MVELETGGRRVIPLRPLSLHDRVWHLVKHYSDNGSIDTHDTPKVIPEIFLTRLLTTKVSLLILYFQIGSVCLCAH